MILLTSLWGNVCPGNVWEHHGRDKCGTACYVGVLHAVRTPCTKFVQDHTHGLGGHGHAFPSHIRERLCEAHSIGQWEGWPPPWYVFLLTMSKEASQAAEDPYLPLCVPCARVSPHVPCAPAFHSVVIWMAPRQ